MMGLNDMLLDAAIGHQVDLSQYGEGVVRKMLQTLLAAERELMYALNEALEQLPPESFSVRRLDALLSQVRSMQSAAYTNLGESLSKELFDFTAFEGEYYKSLFEAKYAPLRMTVGAITAPQVFAAAMANPFQGRLMSEWFESIGKAAGMRLRDAVSMGYTQGQTVAQIVTRIRGTKALNYTDGILNVDRRNATSIARTAVSHLAAAAKDDFFDKNAELIKAKTWVSTLDQRTSSMCQIRDGKAYTLDNKPVGHQIPWGGGPGSLHWCCRSTYTVVTKSWRELGFDADEISPGTRATMDGQVPSDTTYLDWLKKQPAVRQDEILGPTRGALLREGKLAVSRFWDDKGNYLSLDELRQRNAAAFKRMEAAE